MALTDARNKKIGPFERRDFSRIPTIVEIPNLLELQRTSYEKFLQRNSKPADRSAKGLEEVFQSVFPITNFEGTAVLHYRGYELGVWECKCGEFKGLGGPGVVCNTCKKEVGYKEKYVIRECHQKSMTYADPLKILVQLVIREKEPDDAGNPIILEIKEQKIYLGDLPLMTPNGTLIINGTERVVVSQMHRSPGAFFIQDKGKGTSTGQFVYSARVIPYRGSWLDFEFDMKNILHVRIDRRRKFPATILLRALGYSTEDLIEYFYQVEELEFNPDTDECFLKINENLTRMGIKAKHDLSDPKSGDLILKAGRKFTKHTLRKLEASKTKKVEIDLGEVLGKFLAIDIVNEETGEILADINSEITSAVMDLVRERRIKKIPILVIDEQVGDTSLRNTLKIDRMDSPEDALKEIYRRTRPGDPPTLETAKNLFENLFFNGKRYDLSEVGRLKLNSKLGLDYPLSQRLLTKDDIIKTVKYLLDLRRGIGQVDDIDHLGNRRVRAVGESVENQIRVGTARMEKAIVERMNMMSDYASVMPHDLINAKPVTAAIKEFFGSSQLSQFMDQTNPLSEVTHKRRLSALGPGGLTRERAGFEVRDVHPTHYGRICPIETPEGPNIGLISSLSTYARVNAFGFIETPYRKVKNAKLTNEVVYLSAIEEVQYVIAQANAPIDDKGNFINELVSARKEGDFVMISRDQVDCIDVSPKQLVSVAAALIPFLENDDANRALMGSNMQRQAVPLLHTEVPLVGTGMERVVARDSGAVVLSRNAGEVISVDSSRIVVRADGKSRHQSKVDIYNLIKYNRSNQNTCINQKPIVGLGDRVKESEVLTDGQATDRGELALGRNLLVAFMPWGGYNFEDAMIVSEKVVKEDIFTSIHIEEFEVEARDTKQGKEEITRDIPNVSEEVLKNLDEAGVIRIGAKVKADDILVGKVTPKGETQLSPEEKLLKAIFGEKAGDVRDTSLRVPPGIEGTVISVKIFSRRGVEKDSRTLSIEEEEKTKIEKDYNDEIQIVKEERDKKIRHLLEGKKLSKEFKSGKHVIPKKTRLTMIELERISGKDFQKVQVEEDAKIRKEITEVDETSQDQIQTLKTLLEEKIAKMRKGDELAPGVIKLVKVFISMKRKLQVGDKMAGRHGNKGVVSVIVPEEDMPFMDDGTPIEIILNPLGVPSRMNVGQIKETNLGMVAKVSGEHMMTPVFDGAREEDITDLLAQLNLSMSGKVLLKDGKGGIPFDQEVLVGYIYMMKLHHLVDDKMHSRSTGPYSLVTQQPLGGKAQFGGQRLGEMEVWALEAYGAAYTLQEMLTVKSDDVEGRKRMYETIVKGENTLLPGLPESFNVLVKELQSLALDVELIEGNGRPSKK